MWRLVFDDEFNGTALDTSMWNANWLGAPGALTPPVNDYELANYSPEQVSVAGGFLSLSAEARPSTVDGTTRAYTSGLVNTHGHYGFTYGYAEARIEVSATSTTIFNWPSFWTVGPGPWPQTGEDDIFEGLEGAATWHFWSADGSSAGRVAGDFSGWHTYGADWEPDSVTYYYDGKEVGSTTEHISATPMYLVLNLALSAGPPSGPLVVPATMKVDYVRVWQH